MAISMEASMCDSAIDGGKELPPTRKPMPVGLVIVLSEDATPEVRKYVETLGELAMKSTMLWDYFPIILPKSHACPPMKEADASFYVTRGFMALDMLLETPKSDLQNNPLKLQKPEMLTATQMEEIRKKGIFSGMCCLHDDINKTWKISDKLIKGTENIREAYLEDISLALRFGWITAKDRVTSPIFSVKQSIKSFGDGILDILDLIIGIPRVKPIETENIIAAERTNFIAKGLNLLPKDADAYKLLYDYIKKEMDKGKSSVNSVDLMMLEDPIIPTVFETDSGQMIHLDLFQAFANGIIPCVLQNIINDEIELYLPLTDNMEENIVECDLTAAEIENKLNYEVREEFTTRISRKILYNESIVGYGFKIPKLILIHSLLNFYTKDCTKVVNNNILGYLQKVEEELMKKHPILHRIEPWIESKMKKEKEKMTIVHRNTVHRSVLKGTSCAVDPTPSYYVEKDEEFVLEELPKIQEELKLVTEPVRVYTWTLNKSVCSNESVDGINLPILEPITLTTDTGYTGWRFSNLVLRCISLFTNMMLIFELFTLTRLINWLSEDKEVLEPSTRQQKSTAFTVGSEPPPPIKTKDLEANKAKKATEIPAEKGSDGGQSFKWKLACRKLKEGIFRPVKKVFRLCVPTTYYILAIMACILVGLGSPFLVVSVLLTISLINVFIYDYENPYTYRCKVCVLIQILWKILVEGVIQLIVTITVAFVICPLIGAVLFIYGSIYFVACTMRDFLVFHLLIKHMGRVRFIDMWLAKNIHHVVKEEKFYKEISAKQVLRVFKARLELDELYAYKLQMENLIEQPMTSYRNFIDLQLDSKGITYDATNWHFIIFEETNKLDRELRRKLKIRYEELQGILDEVKMKSYKMTLKTMHEVVKEAVNMIGTFYPRHVFSRRPGFTGETMWINKFLGEDDWFNLTLKTLADLFGPHILTPLDVSNIEYFVKCFPRDSFMYDVPEIISSGKWNELKSITVSRPYLDMKVFDLGRNFDFDLTIENDQVVMCYEKDDAPDNSLIKKGEEKQVKHYYGYNKTFTVIEGIDMLATGIPIPHPIQVLLMNERKYMQELENLEQFNYGQNGGVVVDVNGYKLGDGMDYVHDPGEQDINVWSSNIPVQANSPVYNDDELDGSGMQINSLGNNLLDLQWNQHEESSQEEWDSQSDVSFLENQDQQDRNQVGDEDEWDSEYI